MLHLSMSLIKMLKGRVTERKRNYKGDRKYLVSNNSFMQKVVLTYPVACSGVYNRNYDSLYPYFLTSFFDNVLTHRRTIFSEYMFIF